jgi:hypothetical protein
MSRVSIDPATGALIPSGVIRIVLPFHLRNLARIGESEVRVEPPATRAPPEAGAPPRTAAPTDPSTLLPVLTQRAVLDALEARYPVLRGTIRDHATGARRPFLRYFACGQDLSLQSPDEPLPAAVAAGAEPFMVIGAIAGG